MNLALVVSALLGCWDAERLEVPGRSLTIECREECDSWSLDRVQRLTSRKVWALQIFAGSETGAWRALERAEDRVAIGAYWVQGYPGRARQGGVERVRLGEGRFVFRAIAAVFASRSEAVTAAEVLGQPSLVRAVRPRGPPAPE